MSLKMKELVERSGESKSTILYYLKEGLLPQPQKPKPNVHLYDENCVKIIGFIKYLQEHMHYSISQIKEIFSSNNFNFDDNFDLMINSLKLLNQKDKSEIEKIRDDAKRLGLDESLLKRYEDVARELAKLEFEAGAKLLKQNNASTEEVYKLLFDVILTLKPYIFNQATIKEHKERFDG